MYLHAHQIAFLLGNILTIYLTGISYCMCATEAHFT